MRGCWTSKSSEAETSILVLRIIEFPLLYSRNYYRTLYREWRPDIFVFVEYLLG
jgi:hypothetical protein